MATAPREENLTLPSADFAAERNLRLLASEQAAGIEDKAASSEPQANGGARKLWSVSSESPLRHIDLLKDVLFASLNLSLVLSAWNLSHHAAELKGVFTLWDASGRANAQYMLLLLLYATLMVLACESNGLYRTASRGTPQLLAITKSAGLTTLLVTLIFYLSLGSRVPILVFLIAGALNVVTFTAWRSWTRYSLQHRAEQHGAQPVIIIGAGPLGRTVADRIAANPQLGYVVAGFVDDDQNDPPDVLGGVRELVHIARTRFASEVVVARSLAPPQLKELVSLARLHHIGVRFVPDIYHEVMRPLQVDYWGEIPVLSLHREPIPALALLVKRAMDTLVSGIGLVLSSPLLLLITAIIKLDSPGPALYRSRRVGKKGRQFVCYKFRTMVANADALKPKLMALNEREGPFFKISRDPRLTRVGTWLRKYSLDELPQLWNVFIGDMSLVGPRPPDAEETKYYRVEYLRRLDVKPGITGLWQVTARRDPSFKKAVSLDIQYIENWTPWMDCKILLKTIPTVLGGSGQ